MTFTIEQVKQTTRELLEEFGEDYVYPAELRKNLGCFYALTEDGETPDARPGTVPSCIVGQIAYRLDRELFENLALVECDLSSGPSAIAQVRSALDADVTTARKFADRIFEMQAYQDGGRTWGEAAQSILEWEPGS